MGRRCSARPRRTSTGWTHVPGMTASHRADPVSDCCVRQPSSLLVAGGVWKPADPTDAKIVSETSGTFWYWRVSETGLVAAQGPRLCDAGLEGAAAQKTGEAVDALMAPIHRLQDRARL